MRYTITDLQAGTNYVIRARSKVGPAFSQWSRNFYLLTNGDTLAPKVPANVVGTMAGTSFKLTWDAVTQNTDNSVCNDLDVYEVRVSSSGSGSVGNFRTKDVKFELSYEQNVSVFGTPQANVQMQVRSLDTAGNTAGYSSNVSQTNAAPANPTGFVGVAGSDQISFKWNAVADADLKQYKIYMGTTVGTQATLVWDGLTTTAVYSTSDYATDRYYRVVAVDVFNTESPAGPVVGPLKPLSPFLVDTTAPSVPTGLAASLAYDSAETYAVANVTWTAVSDPSNDLAEYIIGYRPVGATDWDYVKVDYTNTSTKINGLLPYTNYEFRIRSSDFYANLSAWSSTVTATATANSAPSQPATPSVSSNTMNIQVTVPGTKQVGGAMEADVVWYEVYASTTTGFTPATGNMVGQIEVGPAMVMSFPIPASGGTSTQTWFVKIIAVDRGGLKSTASPQATATPGLIAATNIIDATITNAKIADLAADKITAGSGLINALTVKTTLTLGDASNNGIIQSFGYSAGTTGFKIDKTTFEVNQGTIKAAALLLQDGQNLMPPAFADFEFASAFYTNQMLNVANVTETVVSSGAKYNTSYMQFRATTAAAFDAYLSLTTTSYNVLVEASTAYIVSAWVKTGTVASTVQLKVKWSDGTTSNVTSAIALGASGAWQRIQGVVTSVATATSALVFVSSTTATIGAGFDIDGVQVERQQTGSTAASPWTPPSATAIDGGIIRTGEIRSTSNVTVNSVTQPAWSINMSGNAQFGDALIRGKMIVGASGGSDLDAGGSWIQSANFSTGAAGFKIDSAGNVEFNAGMYRGSLSVGGSVASTVSIIAGDVATSYAKMDGSGFSVYTLNTNTDTSGIEPMVKIVSLGIPGTADQFMLTNGTGDVTTSISQAGELVTLTGAFNGDSTLTDLGDEHGLTIGGIDVADRFSSLPQGAVTQAYKSALTTVTNIRTEYGVHEVSFTALPGRHYRVTFSGGTVRANTGAPGVSCIARLRRTLDGTTPSLTNGDIVRAMWFGFPGNNIDVNIPMMALQGESTGGGSVPVTVRIVMTLVAFNAGATDWISFSNKGGTTAPAPLEVLVEDLGIDPVDVYQANSAGGTLYTGGSDSQGGGSPTTQKKTYVQTWTANSSQTRRGTSGFGDNTVNTSAPTGYNLAGYYSSSNGNQYNYIGFTSTGSLGQTISTAISGATVSKVELYVKNSTFYQNSGGSQRFSMTTLTGMPSSGSPSSTIGSSYTSNISFTTGMGKWVTLTSGSISTLTGGGRVAIIGPGSSNSTTYYSKWYDHVGSYAPQLRITYTK